MIEFKLSEFRLFKPSEPQPIKISRVDSLKQKLAKVEEWHSILTKEASREWHLMLKLHKARALRSKIQQQLNEIYNYETIRKIESAN